MSAVRSAGGFEALEAVVALVGQREARLHENRQVALWITRIAVDVEADQVRTAVALVGADRREKRGDAVDPIDLGESVGERRDPGGVDARGVHEAREHVADLACERAGLCVLRLFDDRPHVFLGLFGEQVKRSPPGFVSRDFGALEPRAVHVPVQVVLRTDLGAEFFGGESCRESISHGVHPKRALGHASPSDGIVCGAIARGNRAEKTFRVSTAF